MSKVTDALRRASEESGQKITRAVDELEPKHGGGQQRSSHADAADQAIYPARSTQDVENGNGAINGSQIHAGAEGRNGISTLPQTYPQSKGGFREAMENLLFGRDLAKYEAYPLVAMGRNNAGGEQFKILREKINKIASEVGHRTILVTSPVKGDGKTTVAANLAAAMALDY